MSDHGQVPEMTSAPGFRFFPTEDELVSFYLHNKLLPAVDDNLDRAVDRIIPVLDIYDFNPKDLPQKSGVMVCQDDPEQWFFFVPRQESQVRGGKPKRLTATGYWKATGIPGLVYSNNKAIGVKRSMVFYSGRAPNGTKTVWKMNEYKAIVASAPPASFTISPTGAAVVDPEVLRQEYSLCRLYKKSKFTREFDRRPSAPPVLLIGDDDDDMHEATLATKHPPPSPHNNNNIGHGHTNSVDETPRDHDHDNHHYIIGYDDHGAPRSSHDHDHQDNIGHDHHHEASTSTYIQPILNLMNMVDNMITTSSSMEQHFDDSDYYNDQAFFWNWDLDWDWDICFNGI